MVSLRVERAAGGPRIPATRSGRRAALRFLLLLGAVLKPHESLAQQPVTTPASLESQGKRCREQKDEAKVQKYEANVHICWQGYKQLMDSLEKDWCNWTMVSSPYSHLRECLEYFADEFCLGFPNPWAERVIIKTHQMHFVNCSLLSPSFSDPPEDMLLAMIIVPICFIPVLVTLVVCWSKDSEAQA